MKALASLVAVSFFATAPVMHAEGIVGKFEKLVLDMIGHQNVRKVSVASKIFQEGAYFKVDGIVPMGEGLQNSFRDSLKYVEWHDSLSVCSRDEAEFVIVLETENGDLYGLHSSNGIESDCFYLMEISAVGELHIENTFWFQSVKRSNGKLKAFNRVLRIPKWRSTESGRKILSLVDLAHSTNDDR